MTLTVPLRYPITSMTLGALRSTVPSNKRRLLGRVDNVTVTMWNKGLEEYNEKYPFVTSYDPLTLDCQKNLFFKNWYVSNYFLSILLFKKTRSCVKALYIYYELTFEFRHGQFLRNCLYPCIFSDKNTHNGYQDCGICNFSFLRYHILTLYFRYAKGYF